MRLLTNNPMTEGDIRRLLESQLRTRFNLANKRVDSIKEQIARLQAELTEAEEELLSITETIDYYDGKEYRKEPANVK